MSRKIMRVPLDFDWPLERPWWGYVNPYHFPDCPYCDSTGYAGGREMADEVLRRLRRSDYSYSGVDKRCDHCQGEGNLATEQDRKRSEAWEDIEPPTGEGWQMWETVSEGSPISPVFASSDELIGWMIGQGYSRDAAHRFIEVGETAFSFMITPDRQMVDGVEALVYGE